MASKAFKHGEELRRRIANAQPRDIIELEAGHEYQGPFVIDKPITLIGQKTQTPLFAKNSPCFVILAQGVQLEQIEVISQGHVVSILYTQNSRPIMVDVNSQGRVEMTPSDQVINMGDLLPKQQQARCFIELEVPGPTRIHRSENSVKWLQVESEELPSAGKHLVQILCDATLLGTNAIVVGNITLEMDAEKRKYWVTATVLPEIPPKTLTNSMALVREGKIFRFGEGFLIGKDRFPGLPASTLAERQAIILKEPMGTWSLFAPWKTPSPTFLNNQPLSPGQRVLLQDGFVIRVDQLELKAIVPPPNGVYSVDKAMIDFGLVGSVAEEKSFQIRYNEAGKSKVHVITTLPWVQPVPAMIELKQGEISEIKLRTLPNSAHLQPGKQRERTAILIHGERETLSLDTYFEFNPAAARPRAEGTVDFGILTDWSAGKAKLDILNEGTKEWQANVWVDEEWLTPSAPTLLVPAGQQSTLHFQLNAKASSLPFAREHTTTITLEGDGLKLQVPVVVLMRDPNLALEISPMEIDFKSISDWSGALPSGAVQVTNLRDHAMTIRATSSMQWLSVSPENQECPPGQKVSFNVQLKPEEAVKGVRAKLYSLPNAIIIQAEGKEHPVAFRIRVLQPPSISPVAPAVVPPPLEFSLSVAEVDLGTVLGWDAILPSLEIQLRHNQNHAVAFTISSLVPWLAVKPEQVLCPPEGCKISISMVKEEAKKTLRVKSYRVPYGIIIEGGNISKKLPIRLKVE